MRFLNSYSASFDVQRMNIPATNNIRRLCTEVGTLIRGIAPYILTHYNHVTLYLHYKQLAQRDSPVCMPHMYVHTYLLRPCSHGNRAQAHGAFLPLMPLC